MSTPKKKSVGIGRKGKLFWDEGANRKLIKSAQDAGYKVKSLPPQLRNQKISDAQIAKFAKGMPIVTDDHTAYADGGVENGATAYIQHDSVSTEQFEEYKLKFQTFLKGHTSKTLKGFVWIVPLSKEVIKKDLQ